ncbi:MAG: hypothetical protein NXI20_12685 [bacterium]|nr:hypothetical protein [bacterium]
MKRFFKQILLVIILLLSLQLIARAQEGESALHKLVVEYPSVTSADGYVVTLKGDTIRGKVSGGKIENGLLKSIFFERSNGSKMRFTSHGIKAFGQVTSDGSFSEYVSIAMKHDNFYFYHKILEEEFTIYGCMKKNKDLLLIEADGYISKVDKWLKQGIAAYIEGEIDHEELFFHHNLAVADTGAPGH